MGNSGRESKASVSCGHSQICVCFLYFAHIPLLYICSEISSSALASCVAAFGGLIPNNVRSTIDSILHLCLTKLYSSGSSSIFAYAEAKRSILQFATNCVTVPWGDGGRSTINELVRKVSLLLKNDTDVTVASVAFSTLCVVDAFMTPRAPALLVGSRNQDSISDLTAANMMKSINEKEAEMKSLSRSKESNEKKSSKKDRKVSAEKSAKAAVIKAKKTRTENSSVLEGKKNEATETTKRVQRESESLKVADVIEEAAVVESDNKRIHTETTKTAATNDVAMDTSDTMEVDESTEDRFKIESKSQNGHKNDTELGDDEDDDFSLDDFPEIVDEDPDEGDRM